jgi:hypothetical protein
MNSYKYTKLTFLTEEAVVYQGTTTIDQFKIGLMSSNISNEADITRVTLIIPFNRIPSNQLLKTFIPTFLLGLLGYSTIFIDIERPGDRFMGSATMILVLATWISVISGDLPKTSYVKLIDVWFVWHVTTTFAMVVYHILLDRLRTRQISFNIVEATPQEKVKDGIQIQNTKVKITRINKIIIIIFTFINCTFYGVYFYLSLC